MRLAGIEVRGFKSLTDLRLSDLAHYNAVIGPNNSGKSSIAQALWFLRLHVVADADAPAFPPRGSGEFQAFAREHMSGAAGVTLSFVRDKQEETLPDFSIAYSSSHENMAGSWSIFGPENNDIQQSCARWTQQQFLPAVRYYGPLQKMSDAGAIQNATILSRDGSNLAPLVLYAKNNLPEVFDAIVKDFRTACPDYTAVQTPTDNTVTYLRIDVAQKGRHQLSHMGDGVARVLAWIAAVRTSPGRALIFMEEPETGLHPSLQRRLKRVLRSAAAEGGQQIIVLTHSPIWADVDLASRLYQLTADGRAVNVGELESTRNALGSRPSDSGYADIVLNCEGETEAAALPLLFNLAGNPLASLGVYLRNLRGQGRAKRVQDDLRLTRELGQRLHLSLDWADQGEGGDVPPATAVAAKYGLQLGELTLWKRADGSPGVFEDVFDIETLTEALRRCIAADGEVPTRDALQRRMAKGKTDKALEALYREATKSTLSKPEFGRHAAEICVERDAVPAQVSALVSSLAALVV